jgi:polyhydroxyalkanoate synthesis repressor PhaR
MASDPAADGKRIIKRYSNRKLYDTEDSRYVTLQQIGEMVRRGEDVQIIDNKTKEDKTEVTLALILSEDLKNKPRSVPLDTLRTLIQERGEKVLSSLREGPLGRLLPADEEDPGSEATPSDAPPVSAEVPVAPTPPDAEESKPGRVKETLNTWQAALDERVQAVVPGLGLIRDLQRQVATLSERVEQLEKRARDVEKND